ncbi:uncharacterized protein LOC115209578 [Octopus sinensis]|uniref:Uncharacterized protein LOC115209578 n=1 Tax=Octopus sinensis TaxID=2607531 RepID=A0A6P7S6Q8_9MOLL|nr:uncharacterized protein LOC115209578 [Octopus sinensis]
MHKSRAPLNDLLKKEVKWNWSIKCQNALEEIKVIKTILISDLSLGYFDPEIDIVVISDVSDYGIGPVLLHKYKEGNMKLEVRASRSLIGTEKNYIFTQIIQYSTEYSSVAKKICKERIEYLSSSTSTLLKSSSLLFLPFDSDLKCTSSRIPTGDGIGMSGPSATIRNADGIFG